MSAAQDFFNRGIALQNANRFTEALTCYNQALAIEPGQVVVLNSRGNLLWRLKRFEEALASYEAALRIMPRSAELHTNRGIMLWNLGRSEAALASYDAALAITPGHPEILNNRGNALRDLKRFDQALASYERILATHPQHPYALDGAASAALHLCDWPKVAEIAEKIRSPTGGSVINPFTVLGYSGDMALQSAYARKYVRGKMPAPSPPPWRGAAHRQAKIKLAYLSADFGNHATSTLMAGLVEKHDRSRFEISAFSYGPDDGSEMRARLVRAFDHFIDVRTRSDEDAARMLAAAGVDIAVDLKGHTQDGRLYILSHRPCPVQVHYLGYPGTTGADFIDYIIADRIVAPFEQQDVFREKIVHLPDCYQVNDSGRAITRETPTRESAGLPEEGLVFCCFNNSWKITKPVFEIWAGLLVKVPGSVLWLIDDGSGPRARLKAEAAARGIDPERLVFAARVPPEDHLARHRLADLALDTLPVNAHTTASDALWAGLPLVTCLGDGFAGRVAASLLQAVGLPELVTANLEDYGNLALRLARDPAFRQSLRQKLERNRSSQALFDTDRFARAIEAAYMRMWEIAARGGPPESFAVDAISH